MRRRPWGGEADEGGHGSAAGCRAQPPGCSDALLRCSGETLVSNSTHTRHVSDQRPRDVGDRLVGPAAAAPGPLVQRTAGPVTPARIPGSPPARGLAPCSPAASVHGVTAEGSTPGMGPTQESPTGPSVLVLPDGHRVRGQRARPGRRSRGHAKPDKAGAVAADTGLAVVLESQSLGASSRSGSQVGWPGSGQGAHGTQSRGCRRPSPGNTARSCPPPALQSHVHIPLSRGPPALHWPHARSSGLPHPCRGRPAEQRRGSASPAETSG